MEISTVIVVPLEGSPESPVVMFRAIDDDGEDKAPFRGTWIECEASFSTSSGLTYVDSLCPVDVWEYLIPPQPRVLQ